MSKESIFGEFKDKEGGKTASLSCRVSEETRKLFEAHAKLNYGDMATGLKLILFDYMSRYAFRRQIVNIPVNIFIPLVEMEDNEGRMLPCDTRIKIITNFEWTIEHCSNLNSTNCSVTDYRGFTPSNEYEKDEYDKLSHWLHKESDYTLDDGIIITEFLNNYLDKNIDGIYRCIDNLENYHKGLFIFEFEGEYYYITTFFGAWDEPELSDTPACYLISNEEAYEKAFECGNFELAKFIDSLNEGTSNIEKDKEALEDKKEKLIHQLKEIDEKLTKLE